MRECRYHKTPAQVMIRWSLQRGFVCIPKSSNEERIAENANVFDFNMSDEDMQKLVNIAYMHVGVFAIFAYTEWFR